MLDDDKNKDNTKGTIDNNTTKLKENKDDSKGKTEKSHNSFDIHDIKTTYFINHIEHFHTKDHPQKPIKQTNQDKNSDNTKKNKENQLILYKTVLPIVIIIALILCVLGSSKKELPKNDEQKNLLLITEADQGKADAQCELGNHYFESGHYERALHYFKQSADQNYAEAQLKLGDMYYLGLGVTQNKKEVANWYERSAKNGNGQAAFNRGMMSLSGEAE